MIPVRIDKHLDRTPIVNYVLIAINVGVFVFFQRRGIALPVVRMYMLHPDEPQLYQYISSMFMHAGWMHLIGNMIFLWVFGNALNDSFGHVGYLAFYLAGGIMAGLGYVLLSGHAPVLGASGAISAVTGAFLVLFPRVRVTVLMFLVYVIFPLEISALLFLLLQFLWNVYATAAGAGGGVAYVAHSSGYVFGIGISAALLAAKVLPRDVYDLLSLIRTWRRRRSYQRAVSDGYDPYKFHRLSRGRGKRPAGGWVHTDTLDAAESDTPAGKELQLRRRISTDHAGGNFPAAAEGYLKLVRIADDALLPLTQQLDVANYLMSDEQYPAAADAYERFIRHYPNYEYMGDIRLMLGLIYSRYLHQKDRAERYLARAVDELTDARKLELAREELARLRGS